MCFFCFILVLGTVLNSTIASLTTAIIIGSFLILAIIVGILAWTYPLAVSLPRRSVRIIEANESNNQRPLVAYPNETPPTCGFRNVFGRRSLIGPNEVIESLRISPSNPAIFGDDKCPELSMKVFLTPPTPSREEDYLAN